MRSDDASSMVSPMVHPKDERIFLKIFTNVDEKDIKVSDFHPKNKMEKDMYKYSCPICMRYFNSNNLSRTYLLSIAILISDCCRNYTCLFCARHLQQIEQKNESLQIACP